VDTGLSVPELIDYRDRSDLFENITGIYSINANVTGGSEPERVEGQVVSGSYFQVLRVNAAVGRVFGPADEIPGIAQVVVITNSLSRRRFGGPDASIGQHVRIDNDLFEIIGVLAPEFRHPGRSIVGGAEFLRADGVRGGAVSRAATRLVHSQRRVRAAQARHHRRGPRKPGWGTSAPRCAREYPRSTRPVRAGGRAWCGCRRIWSAARGPALIVLLCAVAAVLLIACVNVANLLVARAPCASSVSSPFGRRWARRVRASCA
jgi:hypothetical protein